MNVQEQVIIERRVSDTNDYKEVSYKQGVYLGKGGFAKVFEVTDQSTNKQFACKIIKQESLQKTKARQKLMQEIEIHKVLEHEGICKFDHYFEDTQNVYILMELCVN